MISVRLFNRDPKDGTYRSRNRIGCHSHARIIIFELRCPMTTIATRPSRSRLLLAVLVLFLSAVSESSAESNWPRWRGPRGDGHSDETNLPVRWSAESVAWKVPVKGIGQS